MNTQNYSSFNTIKTVAAREIAVTMRTKSIIISIIITLLVALGAIGAMAYFNAKDEAKGADSIAVVGMAPESFSSDSLTAEKVKDRAEAKAQVENGDVEAALVPLGEDDSAKEAATKGWELLFDGSPDTQLTNQVQAIVAANATNFGLAQMDIDPAELAKVTPNSTVTPQDISFGEGEDGKSGEANMAAMLTVLGGIMVIIFVVMLFAGNIGGRVTEEKSSRVVEIVLSSVRPLDFLAGKLVGNTLFGFLCSFVIVAAAGTALYFSGLLDGMDFDWSILPLLLVALLLGLMFFGSLYAAAGAMVLRTEDLQSTQTPILFLVMATMYIPLFGWTNIDATWMQVMAWIPPFSMGVAPLQMAAGNMSLSMVLLSYLIFAVTTFVVLWFVSRIYRRAILNNGKKMTWRQAFSAKG